MEQRTGGFFDGLVKWSEWVRSVANSTEVKNNVARTIFFQPIMYQKAIK